MVGEKVLNKLIELKHRGIPSFQALILAMTDYFNELARDEKGINIVLKPMDGDSPSNEFIEIENDEGKSITIGESTVDWAEGYIKIRITASQIEEVTG